MRLGQARLKFSYITSMIRTNSSLSRGREQWISLDRNLYSKVSTVTKERERERERERESSSDFFPEKTKCKTFGRNQIKDIWEKPNERHLGETNCREAFGSNQMQRHLGVNNA